MELSSSSRSHEHDIGKATQETPFRYGFSKEERKVIQIAHESSTGHYWFYKSLGIGAAHILAKSKEPLEKKFLA